MATIKITELPSLTTPDANTSNTVFVVVDKSSGIPTTKQVTLGVLDTAIDDVAAGAYDHANGAFDLANTDSSLSLSAYDHANGAFDHANVAFEAANTVETNLAVLDTESLQFVSNSAPASPIGVDGDVRNHVAYTNTHIYIAQSDYDGSTNIWVRFAVSDAW